MTSPAQLALSKPILSFKQNKKGLRAFFIKIEPPKNTKIIFNNSPRKMSHVKKTVKFVEEKENTKNKKMHRSKERNNKYEEKDDTKVIEDPPQHETPKEFEETFAHYKRCCDPKDPLYQAPVQFIKTELCEMFTPIKELEVEIMQPSVHYAQAEGEGWESDYDDWFD